MVGYREVCYATGMKEDELIRLTGKRPITGEDIVKDLQDLGLEPGSILLVHSSLSSLGWVSGAAQAVILALEEAVREWGLLVMPAHSGQLSDPSGWVNPPVPEGWWEIIRQTMPVYDPDLTPTRGIGVIPELFRVQSNTIRSSHPQYSFAFWGERALDLVNGEGLDFGLGPDSPLQTLYDEDAWVLLLGAGYESNTSFHLAEYLADYPRKTEVDTAAPVLVDGHRRWKWFKDINIDSDDFGRIGMAFEKKNKQVVKIGRVGMAETRLFPMRLCVDFAVQWMERHRV